MAAFQLLLLLLVTPATAAAAAAASAPPPRHLPPCQVVHTDAFCSDLSLRAAPRDLPHGVQTLDLSRNQVQNLSRETLAFHTGLRRLDLHANKIHFIQPGLFGDMTSLKVLDLSRNHLNVLALAKVSVGPLASVESLDLSHNGLYTGMSDYFLSRSPSLADLSLDSNSITRIAQSTFSGALALRRISLRNNVLLDIEDGAFDSLDHLRELDLSQNSITCITDFNLYNLRALNLSANSVELFHSSPAGGVYQLASLDLSRNKLSHFPLLPENNVLERLDVSRNRLRSVNVSGDAGAGGADRGAHVVFDRLRFLDMSYNQLTAVPECFFYCMGQLEALNVSNNCLRSFAVTNPDVLRAAAVINLSRNALRSLTFAAGALPALERLLLQGNQLRTLDPPIFQRLSSLEHLQLQQNQLQVCGGGGGGQEEAEPEGCVSFWSVAKLQSLRLSENGLRSLPADAFAGTPLTLLDLSLNPGLDMDGAALAGLQDSLVHLLLRDNNMSRLNTDLSALRRLRHVDLSANRLASLPAWSRESAIESLDLRHNNLVALESSAMAALERSLKTLYVGSNPLSCCGSLGFLRLLQRAAVVVPDIATVTCVHPRHAQPVGIERVTEDMCRRPAVPKYAIAAAAALAVAALALALLLKCLRARRQKGSRSFSA